MYCEICGLPSADELCDHCSQSMADGSWREKIRRRVQEFDNSEYERDELINNICEHFGLTLEEVKIRRRWEPNITAKHLIIYIDVYKWNRRKFPVAKCWGVNHSTVDYICKKWDGRLKLKHFQKEYGKLLQL